jgi:hypothetical protein
VLPRGSERVVLDPADFTTRIDNPYWPMRPGTRWVYRETDPDSTKLRDVVRVTDEVTSMANGSTPASCVTPPPRTGRSWRTRGTVGATARSS